MGWRRKLCNNTIGVGAPFGIGIGSIRPTESLDPGYDDCTAPLLLKPASVSRNGAG